MLKLLVSESYYLENKNTISQNNIFTNYLSDTFQYHIFLLFHTVHGVLKARILKWFAIPLSSGPITSWQIGREAMETVTDYFLGLQNHCRW